MAVGANITFPKMTSLLVVKLKKNGFQQASHGRQRNGMKRKYYGFKNGVPASNTPADNPNALGDIIINTAVQPLGSSAYQCTHYDPTGAGSTYVNISPT